MVDHPFCMAMPTDATSNARLARLAGVWFLRHQTGWTPTNKSALSDGVEWNYRVISSRDEQGYEEARAAFERLFYHPATATLTKTWIEDYKLRRKRTLPHIIDTEMTVVVPPVESIVVPTPHSIQIEALEALCCGINLAIKRILLKTSSILHGLVK